MEATLQAKFRCPAKSCTFMTVETCSRRIARAAGSRSNTSVFDPMTESFRHCFECKGPVRLDNGRVQIVKPKKHAKKWHSEIERAVNAVRNMRRTLALRELEGM